MGVQQETWQLTISISSLGFDLKYFPEWAADSTEVRGQKNLAIFNLWDRKMVAIYPAVAIYVGKIRQNRMKFTVLNSVT